MILSSSRNEEGEVNTYPYIVVLLKTNKEAMDV